MYKKRNVAYVKPQEPSFLTKLKKEAGYVPGPDINTKKEHLPVDSDSDSENPENPEENPVIVVVKPGDLSAEEVAKITADQEFEKSKAPADLSKKIIFQKPINSKRTLEAEETSDSKKPVKKHKKDLKKHLLSFDQGEEDEC